MGGCALLSVVIALFLVQPPNARAAPANTSAAPFETSGAPSETSSAPPKISATTEQLTARIPEGWVKAHSNTFASMSSSEWIPSETTGDWQQKITLEAMQVDDPPDPIDFVQGLADSQRSVCNEFAENTVFAGFENGYPAAVHLLQCGENKRTRQPLLTMVKAIRGNSAFYTITRIWRLQRDESNAKLDDGTLPVDTTEVAAWATHLGKFTLCDPSLDAHPCD
jgi:hypothetical protein